MTTLTREDFKEIRRQMGEELNDKINAIIESRLINWYEDKVKQQVDRAIKEEFAKMMIVKFGG